MEFEFSALQLGFLHLSYLGGDFPRPFHQTWDKVAPKLAVTEAENTSGYPLRLTDNGMETDGGAIVSAVVLDAWNETIVRRAFTVTEIEAMQGAMAQYRYRLSQRRWIDPLYDRLKEYHDQATADDQLSKLPQAAVVAAAKQRARKVA